MLNRLAIVAACSLSLAAFACSEPTKATGGGRIDPFDFYGDKHPNIGFNGHNCDGDTKGQFQFTDNSAADPADDVRAHGDVTSTDTCTFFGCGYCFEGEIVVEANYDSNNNKNEGSGTVTACLRDSNKTSDVDDGAFVVFNSGPYAGYAVEGFLRGNVTDHGCD